MPPANDAQAIVRTANQLIEFADAHAQWFMAEDGRPPLEVRRSEFDFSAAHGRLIFWSWTEKGTLTWRVLDAHLSDDKLLLRVSRKLGAQVATIELVPGVSAKALTATVAAARQMRCEQLARLVAQTLVSETASHAKIERATLSPGMRRDQPGRYARIILRLP